jgi:tRNA-dihydrouridine synthase B
MTHPNFPVPIRSPFLLAPLAGISDGPMRLLCSELGAGMTYTEMVSAKGLVYKNENTRELLKIYDDEGPVCFQLFGSEPEVLAEAAKLIEDEANVMIDVNMGCPVPKITKNGEGSALLKTPDLAGRIIEALVKSTKKPISAKIRIGWDDDNINAVEVAKILESAGASAIAIHARTKEQYYSGSARWEEIARVKHAVDIPVIGNGDVYSGADACRMIDETGCDAVMIARGAYGNPWIFREAILCAEGASKKNILESRPSLEEKSAMFIRQLELSTAAKGEYTAVREMRKHVGWYFKGYKGIHSLKAEACRMETKEQMIGIIQEFSRVF